MAYIPPHRRTQAPSGWPSDAPTLERPISSPHQHLQHRNRAGKRSDESRDSLTIHDIHTHYKGDEYNPNQSQGTLNVSLDEPYTLKYLLLFRGANPRWQAEGLIFVKSNLYVLPEYPEQKQKHREFGDGFDRTEPQDSVHAHIEAVTPIELASATRDDPGASHTAHMVSSPVSDNWESGKELAQEPIQEDENVEKPPRPASPELAKRTLQNCAVPPIEYSPASTKPIAVFDQRGARSKSHGFIFIGYYKIAHIALLAPQSEALVRMLMQKWEPVRDKWGRVTGREQQRNEQAWRASLAMEWAVVKFEKLPAESAPKAPHIKKVPVPEMNSPSGKESQEDNSVPQKSVNELLAEMRLG